MVKSMFALSKFNMVIYLFSFKVSDGTLNSSLTCFGFSNLLRNISNKFVGNQRRYVFLVL